MLLGGVRLRGQASKEGEASSYVSMCAPRGPTTTAHGRIRDGGNTWLGILISINLRKNRGFDAADFVGLTWSVVSQGLECVD